jgi:hypothetical protein
VCDPNNNRKVLQYLAVLSLLSTAFCGLFSPILSDEVFSLDLAATEWRPMLAQLRFDVHPPLYYWLLRVWFLVVPATEAGLRSFSGVCLITATILFWRFLRRATGLDTAYAALALWLANPLVILMAGYGRMYLLLAIWCVVALDAAWRVCAGSAGRLTRVGLAAATLAGLLTHNWFVFFLCGLSAMMLWQYGKAAFRLAAPLAAGGTLYALLWGGTALQQATGSHNQLAWLQPPDWQAPLDVAIAHLWLPLLAAPLILMLVAVRKARIAASPLFESAALLGAGVTIALPLAVSMWRPIFNPRFTIVAAPFLVFGLAGVVQRRGSAAAALLLVLGAGWGIWDANHPSACNSRSAAAVLSQQAGRGDAVIYGGLSRKPVEWYWRDGAARRFSFPAGIDAHPGYEGAQSEASLRAEARQIANESTGRVFVLADPTRPPSRILLEELRARWHEQAPPCLDCEQVGKHYFSELILFDLKKP